MSSIPFIRRGAVAAALAISVLAHAGAQAQTAGALRVSEPWTRATNPGQTVGGGYLLIRNEGAAADRLLSASSPAAERVELHSMALDGDVMRMRPVEGIDLPAGGTAELKPGGLHLMLIGLKEPLKSGASVPVTLRFEKAGAVEVNLGVRASGAVAPTGHGHSPAGAHGGGDHGQEHAPAAGAHKH